MVTKPKSLRRVRILKQANNKTRYKHKKPSDPSCALCNRKIIFFSTGKQAKTKRRAQRPLPNLCSKCMRKVIMAKTRNEVTPSLEKYAEQVKIEQKDDVKNKYVKTTGRDAGDIVEIVKEIDDKFVEVQGTQRKKARKVNRAHLEPLMKKEAKSGKESTKKDESKVKKAGKETKGKESKAETKRKSKK